MGNIFYFEWEINLLHWFQDIHNNVLDVIVPKITFLGNAGWFWILLTLLFLVCLKDKRMGAQCALALILTAIVCNVILKPLVMRARPCWIFDDVQLLIASPDDYSFPSGHTNASFAVAISIFSRNKKWGIAALVLAALIALSRLYLYVHWPTDVICGIVTGVIGGVVSYFIVNFLFNKYNKRVDI